MDNKLLWVYIHNRWRSKVELSIKINEGGEKICQGLTELVQSDKVQELAEVLALAGAE
jgi:hypothetical protein